MISKLQISYFHLPDQQHPQLLRRYLSSSQQLGYIVFGLLVSVPLIIGGSRIVLFLIDRFPIIVTAGAGLLGWIAGGMIMSDPGVMKFFGPGVESYGLVAGAIGAIAVMGAGELVKRKDPT